MKLGKLINPKSIAIIGASADDKKLGRQVLDNIINGGFSGRVMPINPKEKSIAGLPVEANILDAGPVDLAIIVIPAKFVIQEIKNCVKAGVGAVIVISAGFGEDSPEGKVMEEEMAEIARESGLPILGPNCLGVINPSGGVNATFARGGANPGRVAFVSQSGAICSAVLDWAHSRNTGFSKFVSLGNKAVIDENHIFDLLAEDPETDLVVAYLEEVADGRRFMASASRLAMKKTVAILKGGMSRAGSEAALSHTGGMAGSAEAIRTAVERIGGIFLDDLEEMFNLITLFGSGKHVSDERIYMISNAGGPLVLTADSMEKTDLTFGQLGERSVRSLSSSMPSIVKTKNPLDIIGDADGERYRLAIDAVLSDKSVKTLLVLLTAQSMTEPVKTAHALIEADKKNPEALICASFIGGEAVSGAVGEMTQAGIPVFEYPNQAIATISKVSRARASKIKPYRHDISQKIPAKTGELMDYLESFAILKKYGIDIVPTTKISQDKLPKNIFPAVAKVVGKNIIHKIDGGFVRVGLKDEKDLGGAVIDFGDALSDESNYAVVQPMIDFGHELIIGFRRDQSFGPLVMVGAGGTGAEIFKDMALEVSDVDIDRAKKMLEKLKILPILQGFRGKPGFNIDKICQTIVAIAKLANEHPEIHELDINPLFLAGDKVLAADVRMIK